MKHIISATDAFRKLDERDVVFIDCRFELSEPTKGRMTYENEHIPGAIHFDLEKDLSAEATKNSGRHPLPDLERFIHKLEISGINQNTVLYVYDDQRCAMAARFWWLMKLLGHQDVYIIDGGWKAWKENDYPTSSTIPYPICTNYESTIQWDLYADQDYVKLQLDDENATLIDSRSYPRYAGIKEPIDKKAGHIPTALHFEWLELFTRDGKWKDVKALQQHFSTLDKEKEIIVYCGSGVTAVPNFIALKECGFSHVRLYVGSFSDWITDISNRIETIPETNSD